MADGAGDDEYLGALIPTVQKALDEFRPQILFYVGGADPYCEDQLGGLSLTKEGLKQRDRRGFLEERPRRNSSPPTPARGSARPVRHTLVVQHTTTFVAQL